MKNLIIGEPQNDIARLSEIAILAAVTMADMGPVMPVEAIALNDDSRCGQQEINHEPIDQRDLFLKGDAVLTQGIRHCDLQIGTVINRKSLQVAQVTMFLAAILAACCAAWKRSELDAAIGAGDDYLWFPFGILGADQSGATSIRPTLSRAEPLHLRYRTSHMVRLAAAFTSLRNQHAFFVDFFTAIARLGAVSRAELGFLVGVDRRQERLTAFATGQGDARRLATSGAAKMIGVLSQSNGELLNRRATSGAMHNDFSHKRNLLSALMACLLRAYRANRRSNPLYQVVQRLSTSVSLSTPIVLQTGRLS